MKISFILKLKIERWAEFDCDCDGGKQRSQVSSIWVVYLSVTWDVFGNAFIASIIPSSEDTDRPGFNFSIFKKEKVRRWGNSKFSIRAKQSQGGITSEWTREYERTLLLMNTLLDFQGSTKSRMLLIYLCMIQIHSIILQFKWVYDPISEILNVRR